MSISVIDFQSPTAGKEFAAGLKEIGFAVIANHPISTHLIDQVYSEWYAFFKSPEKFNYPFDPVTHTGYISTDMSETAKGHTLKDLKEFYHYYLGKECP